MFGSLGVGLGGEGEIDLSEENVAKFRETLQVIASMDCGAGRPSAVP
jgi:hypothetical protein